MDDLIIEVYGLYPYENHSYSDPIVIQPPTIEPPTNTAAHDVPDDDGGWIYIDYELSLNDPFHSSTEMPNIHYYLIERDADTTAVEDWQAFAFVDVYDPENGDNASVMLNVTIGYTEYDYRMAAVYNQGSAIFAGSDDLESQINDTKFGENDQNNEDQIDGPEVIYFTDLDIRDQCWQSEWADCGSAAGCPGSCQGPLTPPVITNIYDDGTNIYLEWDAVDGATSYKIYSSLDPYAADWGSPIADGITGTSWNEPLEEKKFYRVTANN